jgi:hypothetical protein
MVEAGFGPTTIVAAIQANVTAFDVAPKTLLSLKKADVPEAVIEAMLVEAAARKKASAAQAAVPTAAAAPGAPAIAAPIVEAPAIAAPAPVVDTPATAAPDTMSPEALAALSRMIEQLAAVPPEAAETESAPAEAAPPPENLHVPRAWVSSSDGKVPLALNVAQVAYTDMKRPAATAFKTLQNFTGKALAFANPVIGAATSGLGGLFRDDDPEKTAVWALLGSSAPRQLDADSAFEIEFGQVPGVDPDQYQPAIVQLVPTSDNYRLVGAAKIEGGDAAAAPREAIIEEPVAAQLTQMARGRYRIVLRAPVAPGEYALVLRPVEKSERERRRGAESSLGALMGASGSAQILYLTWDFSIAG